jgi:signal transduction histidine kinase
MRPRLKPQVSPFHREAWHGYMSISPVSFADGCSEIPVFIVGVDKTNRKQLCDSLRNLDYRVTLFSTGHEAQNAIQHAEHHVILLIDWMMPDCSGILLCSELSGTPPPNMVHIIMAIGNDNKNAIAFALDNGADDVIMEPFEIIELRAHINVGMRMIFIRQRLIEGYRQLLDHYRYVETLAKERAEQLVQADRLSTIGILSAGIAHEVNNPVSFISVNIQSIEEIMPCITAAIRPEASDEQREKAQQLVSVVPDILSEMKSGVARIKRIVDGLRTYVHAGPGNQCGFPVTACIESALNLCCTRLKYHVAIVKEYADTPPVYGDQNRIEQVFVNLLTNAADAVESTGHDGTIAISVSYAGSRIVVTVHDTGPGIRDEEQEKIFMPFFTTKAIGKGTGLGLAISKNIIEDHRGMLTVKNHPNGGAVFTILLPPQLKAAV